MVCLMMRTAMGFLPLLRPCIIIALRRLFVLVRDDEGQREEGERDRERERERENEYVRSQSVSQSWKKKKRVSSTNTRTIIAASIFYFFRVETLLTHTHTRAPGPDIRPPPPLPVPLHMIGIARRVIRTHDAQMKHRRALLKSAASSLPALQNHPPPVLSPQPKTKLALKPVRSVLLRWRREKVVKSPKGFGALTADDGTLRLAEALRSIATGGVGT